ncbi:MAG TPA: hypothetical protein PLS58_06130 [Bacteroidales bacterium]|nr:hypothetical protein [Bacteroidales bacterium]
MYVYLIPWDSIACRYRLAKINQYYIICFDYWKKLWDPVEGISFLRNLYSLTGFRVRGFQR